MFLLFKLPEGVSVDTDNRFAAIRNIWCHHQESTVTTGSKYDISPVDERLVKIIAMYEPTLQATTTTAHTSSSSSSSSSSTYSNNSSKSSNST